MGAVKLSDTTVSALTCPPGRKDLLVFDATVKGFGLRVTAGYTTLPSEITQRSPPSENNTAAMIRRETGKLAQWDDIDSGIGPYISDTSSQRTTGGALGARGAPMTLGGGQPSGSGGSASDPTVRLHIAGDDGYKAKVLSNPAAVPVQGPLVETPGLLGAMP